MKKMLQWTALAALSLGLAACGGNEGSRNVQAANAADETIRDDTIVPDAGDEAAITNDLPDANTSSEDAANLAGGPFVNGQ